MTGDSSNDDDHDESDDRDERRKDDGGASMKSVLDALRMIAREEETEAAALSPSAIPELSNDARDRLVQSLMSARMDAEAQGSAEPTREAAASMSSIADARAKRECRPRRTIVFTTAGLLAAVAAAILWVRPSGESLSLPSYAVTAEGGAKDVRGIDAPEAGDPTVSAVQRVRDGSELIVTLRPSTSVSGDVTARAFVTRDAELAEVHPRSRVAPSGAVQLVFAGADVIGSRRGRAILRVVVGRPRALSALAPQNVVRASSGQGWRAVTVPLTIEADAR
jgi:hypothetical protein